MKKIVYAVTAVLLASPAIAFAQTTTTVNANSGIYGVFQFVQQVLSWLVPIIIGIAVIYFLWGVVTYIQASGDAEKRKEAQGRIIYGIIGIFVMVALWGLVGILQGTLTGGNSTTPTGPALPSLTNTGQ